MIVDANVLLYAVDSGNPFHDASKTWLETALNGPVRVGLPWNSLCAFIRISTHPRASANPLAIDEAWSFVEEWLAAETVWTPAPTSRHAEVLRDLLVDGDLRGNMVTDAHLAALAIEHGVGVCSVDSDFARFPKLEWINPLTAG
ncbi:TA system VapC family ribonuclease toxin [Streptosporangium sp. NPDC087985]|uniref:TA system VapC family ribonuclease toxin n=1 Tax=Streptosporangium sp. NPDC087985 TaxID=3366196 RepID=UPI00380F2239